MRKYFWHIVFVCAVLVLFFGSALIAMYTDWLWFKDLGYGTVFSTRLLAHIQIGLVFGGLFFAFIYGNLWYARKIAPPPSRLAFEQQFLERLGKLAKRTFGLLLFAGSIVVSAMVGLEAATHWQEWLMYHHWTPFGATDPVFHRDIGFYVFRLPFLSYIYNWLFFALVASTAAAIGLHYADEAIGVTAGRLQFAPRVKAHISVLVAAMFFLKAWGYKLSMFELLFGKAKLFDGAGFTEIHANLPALWIMVVVALIGGVLVLLNIYRRGVNLAAAGLIVVVAGSLLVGSGYPAAVEALSVRPNELVKQTPYISRAIRATMEAYALSRVAARRFDADTSLTADQVGANGATIENIRLWDEEHLGDAYNQIQTIQQYYHFGDLDVDRYWLKDPKTGAERYRQVWLSARELDQNKLPDASRTWVNEYLQYTHGYGYAMSPVNEVNEEGLPQFFVKDIPPVTSAGLPIRRMGVYFGELTDTNVFVRTSSAEFDYPSGDVHKPTAYSGTGGVQVGSYLRRLLFSLRFSDVNVLLNDNIRGDSRILYARNIAQRTETLFPFLQFDGDPYLVTAGGDLFWMRDGYTTSDAYPYSLVTRPWGYDLNYIRNSVKVVVNAYTGKVDAYSIDVPARDPIIRTYKKMFPGVFKPFAKMPDELRAHIRYPEDLFKIQTEVYARYHYSPKDPQAFYRNNDEWAIPNRASLTSTDAVSAEAMQPYYVIMRLPNGSGEEFILMTPYVRSGGRKNMVAWMCARCDGTNYGGLVLYEFPEEKNVYGPQQIAARISQDPVISKELSLWNQAGAGSRVGSGNLLVIPIENSLLYAMPVYLVSTETKIPELKRVIVALGSNVAMAPTLNEALAQIIGAPVVAPAPMAAASGRASANVAPKVAVPAGPSGDTARLVDQAAAQYDKAVAAQRKGDWAEYGKQVDALKQTLTELKSRSR